MKDSYGVNAERDTYRIMLASLDSDARELTKMRCVYAVRAITRVSVTAPSTFDDPVCI